MNRIVVCLTILVSSFIFSQSLYSQTEAEMREIRTLSSKADALFNSHNYVEATPLYLRLLALQPKNHMYNFKYGVCLLYNSDSKNEAIRYLAYAVKSPEPIVESHFFLGRAYHLNYQFNDAIKQYNRYLELEPKKRFASAAQRNIEMCQNGKALLSTVTDIVVKRKTEVKENDFYRLYDLSEIGGSIITAVDFQSKTDKKNNHIPIVHVNPNQNTVYFSSYGNGDNLDIYSAQRTSGGTFSTPQKVLGAINTPFDEDFPYMHPNGSELYFSSKGHNSMGGYDIFRAIYDEKTNSFTRIENVDFSISSPDDDLLYMVDQSGKNAYFSSRRQSQDGKIVVYKIAIDRIATQLTIAKGKFGSTIISGNPKVLIEVFDKAGKKIGAYNASKREQYVVTFPQAGEYEYHITIEGHPIKFISDVEIPKLTEVKAFGQRIIHEMISGEEQIRIVNQFKKPLEDEVEVVAQVLREKANMEVNEDQFQQNLQKDALNAILAELRLENRSPMEVGQIIEMKATEYRNMANQGDNLQNKINGVQYQLYEQIAELNAQIAELQRGANRESNPQQKTLILNYIKDIELQRDEKQGKIDQIQLITNEIFPSLGHSKLQIISKEYSRLFASGQNQPLIDLLTQNKEHLLQTLHADPLLAEIASYSGEPISKTQLAQMQMNAQQGITASNSTVNNTPQNTNSAVDQQANAINAMIDNGYNTKIAEYNNYSNGRNPQKANETLQQLEQDLTIRQQTLQQLQKAEPTNNTVANALTNVGNKINEVEMLLANERADIAKQNTKTPTKNAPIKTSTSQQQQNTPVSSTQVAQLEQKQQQYIQREQELSRQQQQIQNQQQDLQKQQQDIRSYPFKSKNC